MTMPRLLCAHTEAVHKAKRAERSTYETARRETAQFILAVVEDTWVQELGDTEKFYTDVAPKSLFAHLQAGCTGCHALDLLALHNEIQRYHLEVEGIPKYINMLEDVQKQAGRAGRKIADKTLLLFASTAMLTTERYPRTNDKWEDQAEDQKPGPTGRQVTRGRTTRRASKNKLPEGLTILAP